MPYESPTSEQPPAEETTEADGRGAGAPVLPARSRHFRTQQGFGACHHPEDQLISAILVPTDFSLASDRALRFAVSLAQQCHANLTILHVVDINDQSSGRECVPAADRMKGLWQKGFEEMGKLAFSLSGQVDAKTAIEEGLPWEQIIEKSRDADLLILGKQRSKPGWNLFSKHTGQRVIESAACPVIVVQDPD